MSQNIFVMEAANIFCGDVDPSLSQHLTIAELKLPNIEENFVDHQAGGSPFTIEIDTILQRLEATFVLAGWSPEVATMIGTVMRSPRWTRRWARCTARSQPARTTNPAIGFQVRS